MSMQEISLNLFQIQVKPKSLILHDIIETNPTTQNKIIRFRLAAKIAKRLSKAGIPVFSAGEQIFSVQELPLEHKVDLDIEGMNVDFAVKIRQAEIVDLTDVAYGAERLSNKLIDWYCNEKIPNSFHMENVNYRGENIFAKLESRLYKAFNVNVNEGILRTTRAFASVPFLLLDIDYRVTWEQSLWESVKFFVKNVLNRDVYLPDQRTIQAINEKYGRIGRKPGLRVQGKNRRGEYEVIEFDYGKNPDTPGTAGEKSQQQYFSNVYGSSVSIKDKKQPLVKVRVAKGYHYGKENYHVPELLEFERVPPQLKDNQKLMSALTNISKPAPRGRYSQVLSFVQGDPFGKSSGFADDEFVKQFIQVSREPVTVSAEVLPPINIKMGNDNFPVSSDSEFLKNIWKRKFHRVPELEKVILLFDKVKEIDVLKFYSMLQGIAETLGMEFPEARQLAAEGSLFNDYMKALGDQPDADIVLTFATRGEDEFYEAMKQELLIKQEVLSQNISYENTLDRIAEYERKGYDLGVRTILTLVAMQLCAKLGGAPWAFSEPIFDADSPIVGLDVFHEDDNAIGGCAVFDPYGEYLFSDAKITNLEDLLSSVLHRYADRIGAPKKLFILRDGLNFTQEQRFLLGPKGELATIKKVLSDMGISDYTFVMQKEGTHLRMYKKLSAIKVENPAPGTVLIGRPFEPNEMLMVSQETYQGTVEPVFYKVLTPSVPDMKKTAIAINKLARHHWNTNRAIKVPAPALHADRITYLVRRVLGGVPINPHLLDKPFYL